MELEDEALDDELLALASLCIIECHQEQPETETARAMTAAMDKMREERLRMIELLMVGGTMAQGDSDSQFLTVGH